MDFGFTRLTGAERPNDASRNGQPILQVTEAEGGTGKAEDAKPPDAGISRPGDPVLLPQIIEQRKALFEFFDVLAHDAVLPLEANVGEGGQHSQARMVGQGKFLRDARAREFAEPESAQTTAQLGDRPDHRAPASESHERAFGGERKGPVGSGPGHSTSDEAWRNPARG
jgi:hypothetical protein